jgi:hypothetical protein
MGDTDPTGNLGWDHATFKQVGCAHPTLLHGVMIALAANGSVRRSSGTLLHRNELCHASVSHQTTRLR